MRSLLRKNSIFFIPVWSIILLSGCNKDVSDSHCGWVKSGETCMYFNETQCANPWDYYSSDEEENINAVKQYLTSEGIDVSKIRRKDNNLEMYCMACSCSSGYTIYIQVDDSDISKAEEIGFKVTE